MPASARGRTAGLIAFLFALAAAVVLAPGCGGGGSSGSSSGRSSSSLCSTNTTCVLGEGCWTFVYCSGGSGAEPANQAPTAVLAAPATAVLGGSIALDGSGSSDPDRDPLTYHWQIVSRPLGSAVRVDGSSASAALVPDRFGRYVVALSVDDGDKESGTVYATILVESPARANWQPRWTSFGTTTPGTRSAAMGDVNNDGRADLIVGRDGGTLLVLLADTMGGFNAPGGGSVPASAFGNAAIELADFNGDGRLDIASHEVVLAGNGSGGFTRLHTFTGMSVANVASGDFNGDGRADLALADVINGRDQVLRIMLGDGAGRFTQAAQFPSPVGALVAADFDRDGLTDLVFYSVAFAADGSSNLAFMRGSANGSFTLRTQTLPGLGAIGVGDLDGDGLLDLVISYRLGSLPVGGGQRIDVDTAIVVLRGRGDGTFIVGAPLATPNYAFDTPLVVDLDGDGCLDVVYLGDSAQMNVLRGDGAGGFVDVTVAALSAGVRRLMLHRIDGDGRPDLVLAGPRELRFGLAAGQGF